jgi:hypothetical protein
MHSNAARLLRRRRKIGVARQTARSNNQNVVRSISLLAKRFAVRTHQSLATLATQTRRLTQISLF